MKFKVKVSDEFLKALDIDLHLEEPDRKKVSTILSSLNETIMKVLPKNALKNVKSPISDKTDVKRYDLKGLEKEERTELKNIIKYSDRENFFAFFDSKDLILAVIYDYQIVKLSPIMEASSNINDLLKLSYYFLKFKMEDIEENIKLPSSRIEARREAVAVEREANIVAQREKLNAKLDDFMKKIKAKGFSERNVYSPISGDDPFTYERIQLVNFKVGDILTQDNSATSHKFIIKRMEPAGTNIKLVYTPLNSNDEKSTTLTPNTYFYKATPKPVNPNEGETYEMMLPTKEQFMELIENGQKFPKNLFPLGIDASGSEKNSHAEKLKSLKAEWDEMVSIANNGNLAATASSAIETFAGRVSNQNYRNYQGNSNLTYIDKSGYKVNLAKYFAKLLEVPPVVPVAVKEAYEKAFAYVEEECNKILARLHESLANKEWKKVSDLSYFLSQNGTKEFNEELAYYLKEDSYNRKDPNGTNKKEALNTIENKINRFKSSVENI